MNPIHTLECTLKNHTLEELGKMLPAYFMGGELKQTKYHLEIGRVYDQHEWYVRYVNNDVHNTFHIEWGNDEAESRIAMLCWLHRNGFIRIKGF